MNKYRWVQRHVVLAVHDELLAMHGGEHGDIDIGRLDAALGRPQNINAYETADIHRLAAAYVYGILKNHPFIDGNKRTGFVVGVLFLEINGFEFKGAESEVVTVMEGVASGEASEEDLNAWFEANCRERRVPAGKTRRSEE